MQFSHCNRLSLAAFWAGVVALVATPWLSNASDGQAHSTLLPADYRDQDPQDDERLVCIGALAGSGVFITHGYINSVHANLTSKAYGADEVRAVLDQLAGLSRVGSEQLQAIGKLNIIESDKALITELVEIYGMLHDETRALHAYTSSSADDDLKRFEELRDAVWPRIKKVLGLE